LESHIPKLSADCLPSYGHHKQSGQARVFIDGREILLGTYNAVASREKYNAVRNDTIPTAPFLCPAISDWSDLQGRTILLHADQGFGDTLHVFDCAATGAGPPWLGCVAGRPFIL
jgi:hypothetical protein